METSAFSRILLSSIYSSEGWDFPDSLLRKFYFTRISHYIPYLCHGQNGDDYPRENHQIISNPTIPSPSFLQHPKNHGFKAPFSSYGIGFAHKMWPLFLSLYVFKRTQKNANRAPGFKRLTPGLAPPSFCAAHHRCASNSSRVTSCCVMSTEPLGSSSGNTCRRSDETKLHMFQKHEG